MVSDRRWLRGNTHTHTTYSDGDSPPEVVADWYAEHGYDFIFLTDHNAMIPDSHLARVQQRGLAVWQGEELTMGVVHVNGLGLRQPIVPPPELRLQIGEENRDDRVRWAVEQILAQEAVPSVNHPNRWDALGHAELAQAGDLRLLEIANMSPEAAAANPGDLFRPSTEQLWDRLLEDGKQVWAVASDDAHHFTRWGPRWSNPGRGWLMVEARSTSLADLLGALRGGRFYASTGLALDDYQARGREIALELASGPACIELVGPGGQVLDTAVGQSARFKLPPERLPYARVRATGLDGTRLWTQPHFL
jgi:hypothetical protein